MLFLHALEICVLGSIALIIIIVSSIAVANLIIIILFQSVKIVVLWQTKRKKNNLQTELRASNISRSFFWWNKRRYLFNHFLSMLAEIEVKKYLNKGAFSMKNGKNDCRWLLHVFPENLTFRSYQQGIIRATENLQFKIFVYTRKR